MAQEIADSTLLDTWASGGNIVEPDISKIIEGWQLGEQPPHEYMNWLQNTFGSKLNHILKNGVASWNNETEYLAGSSIQHNGNVWLCKTTNTNSAPTDANANWKRIITVESLTTVLGGYVATTGDQDIDNIKTFLKSPIVPTPTTNFQAATKKYVDDNITPEYNPTPTIATGTATFTATTNNINLTGIGIGVEIGDVIQISGAEDAKNNSEFTVEVITDANNIIVNQAHANKGTSKNLATRSSDTGVTVKLLAKWYNAPIGLGQGWVNVTASRSAGVTYTNSNGKPIYVKIICLNTSTGGGIAINLIVNGTAIDVQTIIAVNTSEKLSVSAIIPPGSTYSYTQDSGDTFTWYELR